MQDQPNSPSTATELDRTEHAVLCLLMDPDAPDLWSVAEVARAIGNEVEAVDALVDLHAAGLIHRCDQFVFVTRPAVRLAQLAAACSRAGPPKDRSRSTHVVVTGRELDRAGPRYIERDPMLAWPTPD